MFLKNAFIQTQGQAQKEAEGGFLNNRPPDKFTDSSLYKIHCLSLRSFGSSEIRCSLFGGVAH